ncbi:MAG: NAD(P)/FAD-dependent oxidoreductase [Hyphomicrobium sp.]|nr:NAD(P)/FAD-dependent oxidoreductase [Hyphomicrobium sp.]
MFSTSSSASPSNATQSYDAVVIGAGVAGLHEVHLLREQGLNVHGFEAGSGVGGTWYWNRYPGCRFDSEAYIYQYFFSQDLYNAWSWSERFPAQPEIERWLNFVADRCDLRKEFEFNTRVESAQYNDATGRWTVKTDKGHVVDTQFLITCCGMLSAPLDKRFPGQETFKGQLYHTARWPKTPVNFAGRRVGVVGNGATGIQVIQTIAPDVGHMKVFVRTPQYIIPMVNPKYSATDVANYKRRFDELKANCPNTFTGFEYDFTNGAWGELTPAQREEVMERIWNEGSLRLWLASFAEMFSDEDASEGVSEFVRKKMRERLKDPVLCELLIPKDYGFGTHRVPLESGYLEVFHRPNVEIVSVKNNAIVAVTPEGIKLANGQVHELDIIILATGFDAGTGALTRIDIRGRSGRQLKDDWGRDIRTTLGMQVHGYPNLFTTGAPLAPSAALCNMTTCLQQQTDWIADCIKNVRKMGAKTIEPTVERQDEWVAHHDELANATLVVRTNSWYMGSNVEGKPRRLLSYIGGVGPYKQRCDEVTQGGYRGFDIQ